MSGFVSKDRCILVTSSFYRTPGDVRLALFWKTVEECENAGYTLVVAESSPTEEGMHQSIMERLKGRPTVVAFRPKDTSMCSARVEAFTKAFNLALQRFPDGIWALVWLEPEKHPIVKDILRICTPILTSATQLVLPLRPNMDGYPRMQQASEPVATLLTQDLFRDMQEDPFFGPVAVGSSAARLYTEWPGYLPQELLDVLPRLWETTHAPWVLFRLLGGTVVKVMTRYEHPPEQEEDENGDIIEDFRRITQLHSIYGFIVEMHNWLQDHPDWRPYWELEHATPLLFYL